MSPLSADYPELPGYMTWDELEQLPEGTAENIELWGGRVWLRHGRCGFQTVARRLANAFERCAHEAAADVPERWRAEADVILEFAGKSDFMKPDFLVFRALPPLVQNIRAAHTLLVGEIFPDIGIRADRETRLGRCADAGIPWYWEVTVGPGDSGIVAIRAYALSIGHGKLADGVRPLRSANYILVGEWTPADEDGIRIDFPFPITVPWTELEY